MSFASLWADHRLFVVLLGICVTAVMVLVAGLLALVQRLRWAQRDTERAMTELVGYRLHLEELVEARTRELAVAKDAAEASARAKGAFLANISHEIRTPMNAVLGQTHLLRRDTDDPRHLDRLGRIEDAAHHLLSLIGDMLDLASIDAGQIQLDAVDFQPASVVEAVSRLMAGKARDKGLAWQVGIAPDLPAWLHGDPLRLRQVLLNFASNAVKFTERGSVGLNVSLPRTRDGRIWLRCEVTDTGCGIPPEMHSRLYRAFEQADVSMSRRHGGMGLGLAIVKRIAEIQGGATGFNSTPGSGSTFWFEAPFDAVAKTPEVDARDTPPPEPPLAAAPLDDSLPNLSCLDTAAGLTSMGGKVSGYRRLLRMLLEQHGDDMVLLRAALARGEREEARRLAHSLKGAAATLGAESLRAAALAAEVALKNGADEIATLAVLDALEMRLNELLAGLRLFFAAPDVADSGSADCCQAEDMALLQQRLVAALEIDDLQANTLWLENAACYAQMFGAQAPAIGKAIERYDFATALRLLQATENT